MPLQSPQTTEEETELVTTELATDDLLELTTTELATEDLLELATELGVELVVPEQAPKSLHAFVHAQPAPGSYGPPIVHQPPTVQEYACALAPFFTIAPVA